LLPEIQLLSTSTPEAQQDLITLALPPKITNTFRMETVRDVGETIEEAKSPSAKPFAPESGAVDLLLSVQTTFGTEELVYILVEHKSYRDTRVAIALLRYVAGLYHKWEKLPLPVIRPVVFYHGSSPGRSRRTSPDCTAPADKRNHEAVNRRTLRTDTSP